MDLKQFVSGTITQIAEGIRDAQSKSEGTGAWINPAGSVISGVAAMKDLRSVLSANGNAYLQEVKFDVALTVSDSQGAGAGGGLQVFGVKLGADTTVSYQNAAVSRVQFSVQVVWPGSTDEAVEKKISEEERKDASAFKRPLY